MALKSGDRLTVARTADGVTVATGPVQQPSKAGDRFVLAQTADGVTVPALVIPISKSGHRGLLAQTADGETTPVVLISGCGADVKEAVAERQEAVGVTPIDTSKMWSLSELKTKVNDIAPNYIDGTYTGGTSAPTTLSDTYADSASTCDELLALVKDMLTTLHETLSFVNGEHRYGSDLEDTGDHGGSFDDAYDAALQNAQDEFNGTLQSGRGDDGYADTAGVCIWDADYDEVTVRVYAERFQAQVSGLATSISKTVRFFVKTVLDTSEQVPFEVSSSAVEDVYDKHGRADVPDEDNYDTWDTVSANASTTDVTSNYFGNLDMPGVTKTGGGSSDDGTSRNHEESDVLALVDWDFTYV